VGEIFEQANVLIGIRVDAIEGDMIFGMLKSQQHHARFKTAQDGE